MTKHREYFEQAAHSLSTEHHIMRWNDEYRNQRMGHMVLYELNELTRPIYSGFPNTDHPYDWPWQCPESLAHRQRRRDYRR